MASDEATPGRTRDDPPRWDIPELVPARMLNEFVYCPRLCYLEWVQGEFRHSADTIAGRHRHRRVDQPGQRRNPREPTIEDQDTVAEGDIPQVVRSMTLSSEEPGLIARIDLVELVGDCATPVDYKKGRAPKGERKAWKADRIQICAQGILLRNAGFDCTEGVIYYAGSRTRVTIPLDEALVGECLESLEAMRAMAGSGEIPEPLEDSPKCPRCSLVGICLPDEVNLATKRIHKQDVRRLLPARAEALPLYVQEQGCSIGKKGERLVVRKAGEELVSARLLDVSHLALFGNVRISPQALRELCSRSLPVSLFSYGGWFYGITQGMGHKNVELRTAQYAVASDSSQAVTMARRMVATKIRNCRVLLRRNLDPSPAAALDEMQRLANRATRLRKLDSLLGVEGAAARIYFSHFERLIKPHRRNSTGEFHFKERNRRPPLDPVNALLSFLYAILVKDCHIALMAVGFDPYLGVYHRPRYGRPALALDLMEEFRPVIVESVVVSLINNGEIRESDFRRSGQAVALNSRGRKRALRGYERRMETLVKHPMFGYSICYRRVLEVQARLLARTITGELPRYAAFAIR